ncbi:MAG TPA: proteasome-type protease [Magnetospirillum sp.]|jgi:putative proteasome-type protease|nr:proteasome-type protease [Magnetospirillum sp.]
MTYCVAMALDQGLVFASDSRTNAGVDHISIYRKMRVWTSEGERVLVLMSAGNLAITQAVVANLDQHIRSENPHRSMMLVDSLYDAAVLVGQAVREIHLRDAKALKENGVDFNVSLVLGGQIKGEQPRLFMIYTAGNFIEATPETPYFQIGETKYGKPIIDRVVRPGTDLTQAAKCALLSIDSTIRSNVTVGLPIDLVIYQRDAFAVGTHQVINEHDPYFEDIRNRWGQGLNALFLVIPDPPWAIKQG